MRTPAGTVARTSVVRTPVVSVPNSAVLGELPDDYDVRGSGRCRSRCAAITPLCMRDAQVVIATPAATPTARHRVASGIASSRRSTTPARTPLRFAPQVVLRTPVAGSITRRGRGSAGSQARRADVDPALRIPLFDAVGSLPPSTPPKAAPHASMPSPVPLVDDEPHGSDPSEGTGASSTCGGRNESSEWAASAAAELARARRNELEASAALRALVSARAQATQAATTHGSIPSKAAMTTAPARRAGARGSPAARSNGTHIPAFVQRHSPSVEPVPRPPHPGMATAGSLGGCGSEPCDIAPPPRFRAVASVGARPAKAAATQARSPSDHPFALSSSSRAAHAPASPRRQVGGDDRVVFAPAPPRRADRGHH